MTKQQAAFLRKCIRAFEKHLAKHPTSVAVWIIGTEAVEALRAALDAAGAPTVKGRYKYYKPGKHVAPAATAAQLLAAIKRPVRRKRVRNSDKQPPVGVDAAERKELLALLRKMP
jgi:hypothetical protein